MDKDLPKRERRWCMVFNGSAKGVTGLLGAREAAGMTDRLVRGKIERLHQTHKKFLAKRAPASSLAVLQTKLNSFSAFTTTSSAPSAGPHDSWPL